MSPSLLGAILVGALLAGFAAGWMGGRALQSTMPDVAVPALGRDLTCDGAVPRGTNSSPVGSGCAGASTPASVYGMRSADGNQTSMSRRIGDN